jgi:hypothetical protein
LPYVIRPKPLRGTMAAIFAGVALLLFGIPAAAQAAPCTAQPTAKVFAGFGDNADYSLAPGGSFEPGSAGWTLKDAAIVPVNEPFKVGAASDAHALGLMATGEAVSPAFCVGVEHPSFRFFARRVGRTSGPLHVKVRWTDDGISKEKTVGVVSGALAQWAPTDSLSLAPSMDIFDDRTVSAQIVLDPTGTRGGWLVDDVYVDPFSRG